MNAEMIAAAVHEAGALLRSDGADLRLVDFDAKTARLRVAVDLTAANCMDCIVPPDLLAEMIATAIGRHVRGELEVLIDDPRRAAATQQGGHQ